MRLKLHKGAPRQSRSAKHSRNINPKEIYKTYFISMALGFGGKTGRFAPRLTIGTLVPIGQARQRLILRKLAPCKPLER